MYSFFDCYTTFFTISICIFVRPNIKRQIAEKLAHICNYLLKLKLKFNVTKNLGDLIPKLFKFRGGALRISPCEILRINADRLSGLYRLLCKLIQERNVPLYTLPVKLFETVFPAKQSDYFVKRGTQCMFVCPDPVFRLPKLFQ